MSNLEAAVGQRGRISLAISAEARSELRLRAIERSQAEIKRTGDQSAHVGLCSVARELIEEWAARQTQKRKAAEPGAPVG